MKIHSGDDGLTESRGGVRVSKASPGVRVLGDLDELNAFMGAAALALSESCADIKARVVAEQDFLFVVGGAFYKGCDAPTHARIEAATRVLGEESERLADETGPFDGFEAPGGNTAAVALNIARAVCRRAERSTVNAGESVSRAMLAYLNRLSDYLYSAGRAAKRRGGF